jgi:hypothetical protein
MWAYVWDAAVQYRRRVLGAALMLKVNWLSGN